FSIDSNLPFVYWGYDWNFNFDHEFGFTYGEPLYYQNVTGLSMEFPWRWTTLTYGFNQYTIFNIENTDSDKRRYPGLEDRYNGAYMASELYTSWKIPVGIDIGEYGALNYTPKIAAKVNYGLGKEVDYLRKTPILTLSHVLGFGQVNWIGNYRSGAEASISNSYEFNFYKVRWDNRLSLSGIYHHRFSRLIGFSGRLMYQQWFNDPANEAGDVLRGVLNDNLSAKYMLSLNVDFPFRLIRFYPSLWFENSKLRLFNFELHISPFFDIALVKDPDRNREFSFRKLVYSGGMEVIVFPGIMRSLYLRGSIGYRMPVSGAHGKKWDEIFIGLGHFY
ncbi:MAG: hypothetical protein LBL43_04745, partial [Treponema sp.]|nr:hypothetical protein [Treponema sp.]